MDKIKKLKIQLSAAIFFLICLIIFGGFFSSGFKNFAYALSSNYSKIPPGTLNLSEWNNLPADFVAKTGDTMTGILDMGTRQINHLADPSLPTDAANKQYVDAKIAAVGGSGAGGVYINWGGSGCGSSETLLYSGIGFSSNSNDTSGSNNPVCITDSGTAGVADGGSYADKMYPIVTTTSSSDLPTDIAGGRIVKCAVCRRSGTCYENYGSWSCNTGAGFSATYQGYVLGAKSTNGPLTNPGERFCVNKSFDSSITHSADGTVWYGSVISNDFGLGYSMGNFILCSICCN